MMLKAIIFDMDGTLSETEDTHRKAFSLDNVDFPALYAAFTETSR
jgi:phosphoglycolate phosphatase-like HAD superfamily hydrolase